jgi:hypothetical protein
MAQECRHGAYHNCGVPRNLVMLCSVRDRLIHYWGHTWWRRSQRHRSPGSGCTMDSLTRIIPAPALDEHAKAGLGAQLDAVAIGVVDIEGLLAVVPGLDLGGDHTFANHVLMGRVNIIHLKSCVVGRC